MLTGCGTNNHLRGLPKSDEFKEPLPKLIQLYQDLKRFEYTVISVYNMPPALPLKDMWGEPHHTVFSGWMLFPPNWFFHHINNWYWEFEDKKVSALIDRPIAFGFKPHVMRLKVKVKK